MWFFCFFWVDWPNKWSQSKRRASSIVPCRAPAPLLRRGVALHMMSLSVILVVLHNNNRLYDHTITGPSATTSAAASCPSPRAARSRSHGDRMAGRIPSRSRTSVHILSHTCAGTGKVTHGEGICCRAGAPRLRWAAACRGGRVATRAITKYYIYIYIYIYMYYNIYM